MLIVVSSVDVCCDQVPIANQMKVLGVILDSHLTISNHINSTLSFIFLSYPCFAPHSFCLNRKYVKICSNKLGGLLRRLRKFPSLRHCIKTHRLPSTRPKCTCSYCFGSWCHLPPQFCSTSIPTLVTCRTTCQLQDRHCYFQYPSHSSA